MRASSLVPAAVVVGVVLLLGSPALARGPAGGAAPTTTALQPAPTKAGPAALPSASAAATRVLSPYVVLDPFSLAVAVLAESPRPAAAATAPSPSLPSPTPVPLARASR